MIETNLTLPLRLLPILCPEPPSPENYPRHLPPGQVPPGQLPCMTGFQHNSSCVKALSIMIMTEVRG